MLSCRGSNTVNAGIRYVITDQSSAGTGRVVVQAGFGSAGAGGALNLYAHSNVTHPGDVVAGISSASGGAFRVNSSALDGGTDWFYVGGTSGRVGIGTTSPSGILHVSKAADNTVGLLVNDASGYGIFTNDQNTLNFNYGVNATSDGYINFAGYNGGTTQFRNLHISNGKFGDIAYFDGVNSRVGIGTTSPGSKLDVNGVIRNSAANGFSIGNDSGQNRLLTSGTTFQFLTSSNAAAYGQLGGLAITSNYGNTAPSNGLYVEGSVGIGKNPTAPLDVVGDINLTGTIHAKYQDVAEWVPSSEQLSAGTVVVLDSTKSNQVTSSSVSYDARDARDERHSRCGHEK